MVKIINDDVNEILLDDIPLEKKTKGRILTDEEVKVLLKDFDPDYDDSELEEKNIQTNQLTKYMKYCDNDKFIRERIPGLDVIFDIFSAKLSETLSSILKKNIQCNLISVDVINYNSFLQSLSLPQTINHFVDNYSNDFYMFIDEKSQKYLTYLTGLINEKDEDCELEKYIMYCISKKMNDILNLSFSKLIPKWKCKFINQLRNPQHISSFGQMDSVVITTCVIDDIDCYIITILPLTFINQFRKYLKQSKVINDQQNLFKQRVLNNIINNVDIDTNILFKTILSIKDIINLKIGQEITFTDQNIIVENQLNNEFIFKMKHKLENSYQVIELADINDKLSENPEFNFIDEFKLENLNFEVDPIFQKLIGE